MSCIGPMLCYIGAGVFVLRQSSIEQNG